MDINVENVKAISGIIAAVIIPIVIAWLGNRFSKSFKEKELQLKYIEIALDILKEVPSKEQAELRVWAVNIVNSYAPFEISETSKNFLLRESPLTTERLSQDQLEDYQKKFYDKFYRDH